MQVGSFPGTGQVVPSTSFYRHCNLGTDPQRCRMKLKPTGGARPRLVTLEQSRREGSSYKYLVCENPVHRYLVATGERGRSWPVAALQSPVFFAFFALPINPLLL